MSIVSESPFWIACKSKGAFLIPFFGWLNRHWHTDTGIDKIHLSLHKKTARLDPFFFKWKISPFSKSKKIFAQVFIFPWKKRKAGRHTSCVLSRIKVDFFYHEICKVRSEGLLFELELSLRHLGNHIYTTWRGKTKEIVKKKKWGKCKLFFCFSSLNLIDLKATCHCFFSRKKPCKTSTDMLFCVAFF